MATRHMYLNADRKIKTIQFSLNKEEIEAYNEFIEYHQGDCEWFDEEINPVDIMFNMSSNQGDCEWFDKVIDPIDIIFNMNSNHEPVYLRCKCGTETILRSNND